MARLLIVEDDSDQLLLRRLILERHGHAVSAASSPAEALAAPGPFDAVLMDLRLPTPAEGCALIRQFKSQSPDLPVIVLSGRPQDLASTPEASLVAATLAKPVRTEQLLKTLARFTCLLLLALLPARAQSRDFTFQVPAPSEVVADLRLAAPGADWAAAGREAAMATLTLDGAQRQQVLVYGGPTERTYSVFLGELPAGSHTLRIERDAPLSAQGAALAIGQPSFRPIPAGTPEAVALSQAPVLLARANTLGRFSDVPLLAYYTRGRDADGAFLEYTIVFSNEDGGTSTRDLMARWGRTVDIEYIYRVWLGARGEPVKTLIQTRDHEDIPYQGDRFGRHPILIPVTDNNMVEPAPPSSSPVRYQLAPVFADLSAGSRELVLDANPLAYLVSAKELQREAKLRPPATFQGENIADPRLYLIIEMKLESQNAAVQALVRLRNSTLWRGSSAGIGRNFIERSGWARTTVELPPATTLKDIAEIGAQCLSRRDLERQPVPKNGRCRVAAFGKVFFLGPDYTPQPPLALPVVDWPLKVGEMSSLTLP